MSAWTVLATGPSLRRLRPEHVDATGPIVAINLAVLSPVRADFWCCLDNASNFKQVWLERSYAERKALPVVWCRAQQAIDWREAGMRCWTFPELPSDFIAENMPAMREVRFSVFHITILATISRCIGLGAKHVDVFGCDLAGREHAFGKDPSNRSAGNWDQRWREELETMTLAIEDWKKIGTTVSLRSPPG